MSDDNVIIGRWHHKKPWQGEELTADEALEGAKGVLAQALILGFDKNGELYAGGSSNLQDGGDLLWIIEQFKRGLLAGEYNAAYND